MTLSRQEIIEFHQLPFSVVRDFAVKIGVEPQKPAERDFDYRGRILQAAKDQGRLGDALNLCKIPPWVIDRPSAAEQRPGVGTCDCCGAQNVELSRGEIAGLEAWSCAEGCAPSGTPIVGVTSDMIRAGRAASRKHGAGAMRRIFTAMDNARGCPDGWMARCESTGGRLFAHSKERAETLGREAYAPAPFVVMPLFAQTKESA